MDNTDDTGISTGKSPSQQQLHNMYPEDYKAELQDEVGFDQGRRESRSSTRVPNDEYGMGYDPESAPRLTKYCANRKLCIPFVCLASFILIMIIIIIIDMS